MLAAHRGCPPSTLTEVSYRAGARPHGQLPVALRTRELKKNDSEPHAGGPIDPPKRQPRKGRPVISMPEAPSLVMGASRRPARPHEQTGVRHMQARRNLNPSPALPSPTPACVCSDSLSGIRVLHHWQRGTCAGITEVQQPVPYRIR